MDSRKVLISNPIQIVWYEYLFHIKLLWWIWLRIQYALYTKIWSEKKYNEWKKIKIMVS